LNDKNVALEKYQTKYYITPLPPHNSHFSSVLKAWLDAGFYAGTFGVQNQWGLCSQNVAIQEL